jgi:hypothetical protein
MPCQSLLGRKARQACSQRESAREVASTREAGRQVSRIQARFISRRLAACQGERAPRSRCCSASSKRAARAGSVAISCVRTRRVASASARDSPPPMGIMAASSQETIASTWPEVGEPAVAGGEGGVGHGGKESRGGGWGKREVGHAAVGGGGGAIGVGHDGDGGWV